jgi:hypothetical protein
MGSDCFYVRQKRPHSAVGQIGIHDDRVWLVFGNQPQARIRIGDSAEQRDLAM